MSRPSWKEGLSDTGLVFVLFWFAVILAAHLMGCATPKAGAKCQVGDAYCSGRDACLTCKDGALAPFDCRGPKGCAVDGFRNVQCDESDGALPGTPCLSAYEGRGQCSKDGASFLVCSKGGWVQMACTPGTACHDDARGIGCM